VIVVRGIALLALIFTAGLVRAAEAPDPACGVMVVAPRPGALVISLPHTFLRANSDSVWSARAVWRPGTDYSLDLVRGELRLLHEAAPGETLHVAACWLLEPPPLEVQRNRYHPANAAAVDSTPPPNAPPVPRPVTAHAAAPPPSGTSLALTGNKTLAVEFGSSQDAVLRQSLDLALSGTLAPGVQLTGVLSDRNTPITTTGTTLDLQSVDQVRIELTAPQGGATLGDLSLKFDDGEFARLERRLQGVKGSWTANGVTVEASAASATGEYNRMEFFGVDGDQGPYDLTDRSGALGISVVAGSEVVVLDGVRLSRGESADYLIDYERARISFSSRHLISSASRITLDYQYALRSYKRNFTAASARWQSGLFHGFARVMSETDDQGRPLSTTLSPEDQLILAAAGDSAHRAIGSGVTAGGGDYDTVRVSPSVLIFAFVAPDSGEYAVQFAPVTAGHGDYADSAVVAGRTVYRYVGPGAGSFVVGRALPLAESHSLWALGAGARLGDAQLEFEGAVSKFDPNTYSTIDDENHSGFAGRGRLRLDHLGDGAFHGIALEFNARSVESKFSPFTRLELPFEAEHWALPTSADFEHAKRADGAAEWHPGFGGLLRAEGGALTTPNGFDSQHQDVVWTRDGKVVTDAFWEHSNSTEADVSHPDGSRDHARAQLKWRLPWIVPLIRAEADQRTFPSDSGRVGDGFRMAGSEVATGPNNAWHAVAGLDLRRDAKLDSTGFVDQSESRSYRLAFDTPSGRRLTASLLAQRRDVLPLADPQRTRSDLASVRVRGEDPRRGWLGEFDTEIGSEGQNKKTRVVTYVGPGNGAYDAFGNFVGTGDYTLTLTVSNELERLARAATHARALRTFGSGDIWRGSRAEFTFESDAQRRGDLQGRDVFISPGAVLGDPDLASGSVLQRFESEIAPQSRAAAFRLRLERHVNADRTYDDFAQTTDDRELNLRWRVRPAHTVSAEIEALEKRQVAEQLTTGAPNYHQTLEQRGGTAQLILTPDPRLRLVGAAQVDWARPIGQPEATRTIQIGPDVGVTIGRRGRADVSFRRAFVAGPPAVALIPTADPAGAPLWQGTSRFDYRLLESFTFGLSAAYREFEGHHGVVTGRLEMRAFF
jgi:hypothetical protein